MKEFLLKIFSLIENQLSKKDSEHKEFMKFQEFLVRNIPTRVAEEFGNMSDVRVSYRNKHETFGLELNPIDYSWWVEKTKFGYRLVDPQNTKMNILNRLCNKVDVSKMTDEEKNKFLDFVVNNKS